MLGLSQVRNIYKFGKRCCKMPPAGASFPKSFVLKANGFVNFNI